MKYKKLQQGGLLVYQPTIVPSSSMPAAQNGAVGSTGNKSSILDDDIVKQLSGVEGLTNDTNALISQLAQLESSSNPFLSRQNRTKALAIIGRINELKQNKFMWEKSYNTAKESKGLNEVAVGDLGEMYVKDSEGNIKAITPEEYKKNTDRYRAMSVAELLEERNSNPNLTGKNEIFNIANNSIGMEEISKYANSIVAALGKETIKAAKIYDKDSLASALDQSGKDIQLTGRKATNEELQGLAILESMKDSPSNYNKVITESSTERNHVLKAAKYIWSTLNNSAQKKLSVQAALNNTDPTNLLVDLIVFGSDVSNSTDIVPIKGGAGSGSGSGSGENLAHSTRLSPFEMFIRGTLSSGATMKFNDPEFAAKYEGLLFGQMPLVTPKGDPIGPTVLENVLKNGEYEKYVDTNNIYFGNNRVNIWNKREIALDGNSEVANVLLPVDSSGKPDQKSLELFRNVMDIYNKNKDTMSPVEIQKLFNQHGFDVTIDSNKTVKARMIGGNVKPFLMTWGYTTAAVDDLVTNNLNYNSGGLRKIESSEKDGIWPILQQAWTVKEGNKVKVKDPKSFMKQDHVYKGIIFMPLREGADAIASGYAGHGPLKPAYTEEDVMYHVQNKSGTNFVPSTIEDMEDSYEW